MSRFAENYNSEQHKFNAKLCTLYMYGMFELAKKSNDQNCVNSKANYVHYMYRMSGCVEKLNIQNSENSTGNSILYMYGMSGFAEN